MNAIARVLALLFAVLLVLALPLCLLAFDTGRVVFNPPCSNGSSPTKS